MSSPQDELLALVESWRGRKLLPADDCAAELEQLARLLPSTPVGGAAPGKPSLKWYEGAYFAVLDAAGLGPMPLLSSVARIREMAARPTVEGEPKTDDDLWGAMTCDGRSGVLNRAHDRVYGVALGDLKAGGKWHNLEPAADILGKFMRDGREHRNRREVPVIGEGERAPWLDGEALPPGRPGEPTTPEPREVMVCPTAKAVIALENAGLWPTEPDPAPPEIPTVIPTRSGTMTLEDAGMMPEGREPLADPDTCDHSHRGPTDGLVEWCLACHLAHPELPPPGESGRAVLASAPKVDEPGAVELLRALAPLRDAPGERDALVKAADIIEGVVASVREPLAPAPTGAPTEASDDLREWQDWATTELAGYSPCKPGGCNLAEDDSDLRQLITERLGASEPTPLPEGARLCAPDECPIAVSDSAVIVSYEDAEGDTVFVVLAAERLSVVCFGRNGLHSPRDGIPARADVVAHVLARAAATGSSQ